MQIRDVRDELTRQFGRHIWDHVDPALLTDEILDQMIRVDRPVYSPSLLEKSCDRFIWYEKGSGLPKPEDDGDESPHMRRGTQLHKACEDYVRGDTDRLLDGLAATAKPTIDAFRDAHALGHVQVEEWCGVDMGSFGRTAGKIDVKICSPDNLGLVDYKTTSKPEKIKSEEVLKQDTQALMYAWALLDEARRAGEEPEKISFLYLYFLTTGPVRNEKKRGVFTAEYIDRMVAEKIFPRMWKIYIDLQKNASSLLDVDTTACRYCRWAEPCKSERLLNKPPAVTPTARPRELKQYTPEKENDMAFSLDEFMAAAPEKPDAQPTASVVPEDAPSPKKEATHDNGTPLGELDKLGLTPTMVQGLADMGVTTAEAASRLTDEQVLQIDGVGPAKLREFRKVFPDPTANPEPEEEAQVEAADENPVSKFIASAPETKPVQQAQAPAQLSDGDDSANKCRLFIDCIPNGSVLRPAETSTFHEMHEELCKELGILHYTHVDFARGAGALAMAWIDAGEWRGRQVVLDYGSKFDRAVGEMLMRYASSIVRGI